MKLKHVFNPDVALQNGILLLADVEGTHSELLTLIDKLYDSNELLEIKLDGHHFYPAIVSAKDEEGITSLRYTNIVTLRFSVNSCDVAQALSDVASNILHLIE